MLAHMEQDDSCQDESHTYFNNQECHVDVSGLADSPVAESKGDAKSQDKPEAPVQVEAKPAKHQCFQVDAKQCVSIGDAGDYRGQPKPGSHVAVEFPQSLGYEGIGRTARWKFTRELAVLVGDEQDDDKSYHET